jgi:hypothetical protein
MSLRKSILCIAIGLIVTSCATYKVYKPLPLNATYSNKNGKEMLEGTSVFSHESDFVWCGSPIKKDSTYYLFYSTWPSGPSIPAWQDSWVLNSTIGVAKTNTLDSAFKSLGVFFKGKKDQGDANAWDAQMVHNPHIQYFDGKYYLYHVAAKDPGIQPEGSPGEKVGLRERVRLNQKLGVIVFDNVEDLQKGKFQRFDSPILSPRTRVKPKDVIDPSPVGTVAKPDNLIVTNPSVVQRPTDGKYLLIFKGNAYDPEWRGVHGVAIGDSPIGPFVAQDNYIFDVKDKQNRLVSAEDPFVWYHKKDQKFYAVMKDFTGKLTNGEPGLAKMESKNGIDWVSSPVPLFLKKEVILANGKVLKVHNLERPALLLDQNDDPYMLFAAVSLNPNNEKKDGSTFNIHMPLQQVKIKLKKAQK